MIPLISTLGAAIVLGAAAVAPPQQSAAVKGDVVSSTISGFNIVLVIGEAQPGGSTPAQDLPAGAKKALDDMREFLPYKHYRVLDVQWTSCCAPRSTTVQGRLQGVTGSTGPNGAISLVPRAYGFLIATSASPLNLPVRFVLNLDDAGVGRRPGGDNSRAVERERQDLQAELETLAAQIKVLQGRVEVGGASAVELRPLQDRHASLQRRLADMEQDTAVTSASAGRSIIDSSFTMDAGETVVVGTSRLGGDKALIAVVTAVRKTPGRRD